MSDLSLSGPVPVLYYDQNDADNDGNGFNVLLADDFIVSRYATLDEAIAEFKTLLKEATL
jgi:hypothetical protein